MTLSLQSMQEATTSFNQEEMKVTEEESTPQRIDPSPDQKRVGELEHKIGALKLQLRH